MKLFQILTVIFCLGILLIPKDNFYMQSKQEICCQSDSKNHNCCNDHETSSANHTGKSKSSCHDDCCSSCILCYTFIETPFSKSFHFEFSFYKANKNLQFQYSDPYISDRLKEIWQPPKIA